MRWNWSSLTPWFTLLLSLSVLDILTTNPNFESNPLALLMWSQFGILLSVLIKIGQVLFLGVLCAGTKKIAKSSEWPFAERVMRSIMIVLVFFYTFVVVWNICMHVLRACIF